MKNIVSHFRIIIIVATFSSFFSNSYGQMTGGTDNGQPIPAEAKPSEISTGASKGDVNLFNGEYGRSYSLGSVGTPSGLGYNLDLSYSTSSCIGDNVPFTSGIPYGQGWSVSMPSITITTTDFHKYTQAEKCLLRCTPNGASATDPATCATYSDDELTSEGQLFTLQPVLSIPGVASGRMVYKYFGTLGGDAGVTASGPIFVLHTFDTYVEAVFDQSGTWHVRLPDGTIYHFAMAQASELSPNNTRLPKSAQTPEAVYTSISPKEEILAWYVSSITNTNHPQGESIQFEYNAFGSFNFFREYDQQPLKLLSQYFFTSIPSQAPSNNLDPFEFDPSSNSNSQLTDALSNLLAEYYENHAASPSTPSTRTYFRMPPATKFHVYKDVFLKSVYSIGGGVTIDRIDLNYKRLDPTTIKTGSVGLIDMPGNNDPDVTAFDSLYNSQLVYTVGQSNGQNYFTNFTNSTIPSWNRYRHLYSDPVLNITAFQAHYSILPTNPYKGNLSLPSNGGTYLNCFPNFYFSDNTNLPYGSTIPSDMAYMSFDHSFLESPRIGGNMNQNGSKIKSGDIYEVRALVRDHHAGTGVYSSAQNALNLDINIVSGDGSGVGSLNATYCNSYPQIKNADVIDAWRNFPVFSTFGRAAKWNTAMKNDSSFVNPLGGVYTQTSSFFMMPFIPADFNGFNIQIGPSNNDMQYNACMSQVETGDGIASVWPSAYRAYWDQIAYPGANIAPDPNFSTSIPSNFGNGYPWSMMRYLYWPEPGVGGSPYWPPPITPTPPNYNTDYITLFGNVADAPSADAEKDVYYEKWFNTLPILGSLSSCSGGFSTTPASVGSPKYSNTPTIADANFSLDKLGLYRYYKTTYMLNDVKVYKTNGGAIPSSVSFGDNVVGMKLVKKDTFIYGVLLGTLTDHLFDQTSNVQHQAIESINIITLNQVSQIPVNPDGTEAFVHSSGEYISDQFGYSELPCEAINAKLNTNGSVLAMTSITNNIGEVTSISYYPITYIQNMTYENSAPQAYGCGFVNDVSVLGQASIRARSPYAFQVTPMVQSKTLVGPTSTTTPSSTPSKTWNYSYSNPVWNDKTVVSGLIGGANANAQFFTPPKKLVERGYGQVTVTEPLLDAASTTSPYTNYYFDYDQDQTHNVSGNASVVGNNDYHTFGKLIRSEYYNSNNQLLETNVTTYASKCAYISGLHRSGNHTYNMITAYQYPNVNQSYLTGTITNYFGQGYSTEYGDVSNSTNNTSVQVNVTDIAGNESMLFGKQILYETDPNIWANTRGGVSINQDLLFSNEALNSYFVYKVSEAKTVYEVLPPASTSPTNPATVSQTAAQSNTGNSTPVILKNTNTDLACIAVEDAVLINNIMNNPTAAQMDTVQYVTEYTYWDADAMGNTSCPGNQILDLLAYNSSTVIPLSYEPSWQVYSVKKYSPQYQDAYNKEEHFYYFDMANDGPMLNQANMYPLNGMPPSNGAAPLLGGVHYFGFEGGYFSRQYNLRNLEYEVRTTTKSPNTDPVMKSKYFYYDSEWDVPEQAISVIQNIFWPCPPIDGNNPSVPLPWAFNQNKIPIGDQHGRIVPWTNPNVLAQGQIQSSPDPTAPNNNNTTSGNRVKRMETSNLPDDCNPMSKFYALRCQACEIYLGDSVNFDSSFVYFDKYDSYWYKCPKLATIPFSRGQNFYANNEFLASLQKNTSPQYQAINHSLSDFSNYLNGKYGNGNQFDPTLVQSLYTQLSNLSLLHDSMIKLQGNPSLDSNYNTDVQSLAVQYNQLDSGSNVLINSYNIAHTNPLPHIDEFYTSYRKDKALSLSISSSDFATYIGANFPSGSTSQMDSPFTNLLYQSLQSVYAQNNSLNTLKSNSTIGADYNTSLQILQSNFCAAKDSFNALSEGYDNKYAQFLPHFDEFVIGYYNYLHASDTINAQDTTISSSDFNNFYSLHYIGYSSPNTTLLSGLYSSAHSAASYNIQAQTLKQTASSNPNFANQMADLICNSIQTKSSFNNTVLIYDSSLTLPLPDIETLHTTYTLSPAPVQDTTYDAFRTYIITTYADDNAGAISETSMQNLYNYSSAVSTIKQEIAAEKASQHSLTLKQTNTNKLQIGLRLAMQNLRTAYITCMEADATGSLSFGRQSEPKKKMVYNNVATGIPAYVGTDNKNYAISQIAYGGGGLGNIMPVVGPAALNNYLLRLYLRSTAVQVDDLVTQYAPALDYYTSLSNITIPPLLNTGNTLGNSLSVLTFDPGAGYAPLYPYQTLITDFILERNQFAQVELERDPLGLYKKYYYNVENQITQNSTQLCYNPTTNTFYRQSRINFSFFDVGLPQAMTVGWGRPDSLQYKYSYNNSRQVSSIKDPNNMILTYTYDGFDRLSNTYKDGKLINSYAYNMWDKDVNRPSNNPTSSFWERANQNYTQVSMFSDQTHRALVARKYIDPFGRSFASSSQVNNDVTSSTNSTNPFSVSGEKVYDNWDRAIAEYRPFTYNPGCTTCTYTAMAPLPNSQNNTYAPQEIKQTFYERDKKNRVLASADFGADHYQNSLYYILNGATLVSQLGLTTAQTTMMMGTVSPSTYRFFETITQDEDGKTIKTYSNPMGQKVAQVTNGANPAVTLFIYDSQGNVSTVINPAGQQNTYKYNLLGQMYEKHDPDQGMVRYKYNQRGKIAIEEDEVLRAAGQFRQYHYDIYGNLVAQGISVVNPAPDAIQVDNGTVTFHTPGVYSSYYNSVYGGAIASTYSQLFSPFSTFNQSANSSTSPIQYATTNNHYTNSLSWLTNWVLPPSSILGLHPHDWPQTAGGSSLLTGTFSIAQTGRPILSNGLYQTVKLEKAFVYSQLSAPYEGQNVYYQDGYLPIEILDPAYTGTAPPSQTPAAGSYIAGLSGSLHNRIQSDLITAASRARGKLIVSTAYDNDNNMIEHTASTYNADGFMAQEDKVFEADGLQNGNYLWHRIGYPQYNLQGSLKQKLVSLANYSATTVSFPTIAVYENSYDDHNRLSQVLFGAGAARPPLLASYTYDDAYNRITNTAYYSSGTNIDNVAASFDARSRLTATTSALYGEALYYDAAGPSQVSYSQNYNGNINATASSYTLNAASNYATLGGTLFSTAGYYGYTYDALNRLTAADAYASERGSNQNYGDESNTYDLIGNMLSSTRYSTSNVATVNTYGYRTGTNQLLTFGSLNSHRSFTYDQNGNMSSDQGGALSLAGVDYGRGHLPVTLATLSGTLSNTGSYVRNTTGYLYADNDNRLYKVVNNLVPRPGGGASSYLGMQEYYLKDATGTDLAIYDMVGNKYEWNVNGNNRIGTFRNNTQFYHVFDHLGNTRVTYSYANSLKTLAGVYEYSPFGTVLRQYSGSNGTDRYLTTQHERDMETGYDYRGARFYDAEIGRFLSLDPHAQKYPNLSAYVYTADNPIFFIDPNGKDWFKYKGDGDENASWHWHDGSTYQLQVGSDENCNPMFTTLKGEKAVIEVQGSRQEYVPAMCDLSEDNCNAGATITLYAPGGDIHVFNGYTMTSNAQSYTPIDEGIYRLSSSGDHIGQCQTMNKKWQLSDPSSSSPGDITTMDCKPNQNTYQNTGPGSTHGLLHKNGIFLHGTCNAQDLMGTTTSTGCLLINGSQWTSFNDNLSRLGRGESALLILTRTGAPNNPQINGPSFSNQ